VKLYSETGMAEVFARCKIFCNLLLLIYGYQQVSLCIGYCLFTECECVLLNFILIERSLVACVQTMFRQNWSVVHNVDVYN
jgi:hypothetical protein